MTSGPRIDWHAKAIWPDLDQVPVSEYVAAGHSLFDGSVSWPVMIVRERALTANLDALAAFCQRHELDFAPHGKTSMAPALFHRQLEAGAWGITLATAHQVRVAFGHGIQRVLLANELLDEKALDAIARLLVENSQREFMCLVDSIEGVRILAAAGARHPELTGGFSVLVDVGWAGGRTGVRGVEAAVALARLVASTPNIRLCGISSYEGGLTTVAAVNNYLSQVREVADAVVSEKLVSGRVVVTAGGSAYFDRVAVELGGGWAAHHGLMVLLRSGAYASHDDGVYVGKTAFNRIPDQGRLDSAIEVWAQVISAPERGLAIVGMGKRDAPYDSGMPLPKRLRRVGSTALEDIDGRAIISDLDDQHGYLQLNDGLKVCPGDLVCFGISHPCTAFDKWRVVPVLDESDRIVDLLKTYF